MKKLVLLQFLLLPVGGLLDSTSAAAPAAVRCEQPSAADGFERGIRNVAERLVGLSYAQSPVRYGR
ncbi:MAG TPA: hypothetical protein VJR89_01770 [Polyangiales bacterium]|nr:hypothetical protein [Polyangiales bacterium]